MGEYDYAGKSFEYLPQISIANVDERGYLSQNLTLMTFSRQSCSFDLLIPFQCINGNIQQLQVFLFLRTR